jgi:uncharacterized protein with HEPN domain
MSERWIAHAEHILHCMDKIQRIQQRGRIDEDEILYDATIRNLQTLSEATQSLPDELKSGFPEIPWKEISGFRNILVHNYLGEIDPLTILAVVDQHLPKLKQAVQAMLAGEHDHGRDF